jgi:hypothetical protein
MKTNTLHLPKSNLPDSKEAAREKRQIAEEQIPDASRNIEGLQG